MPLLYYITDRRAFPGDEREQRRCLVEKIREAAQCGVDYIQLREKDLSTRDLESLAREVVEAVGQGKKTAKNGPSRTALLINSRTDVALAAGADGVHLRSDDISAKRVREIWSRASSKRAIVSISCHSPEDVYRAAGDGADFAVFAPVFEKKADPAALPAGLARLREACKAKIPVLVLGGITLQNARSCLEAGASGVSAIRLFQENEIAKVTRDLR